MAMLARIRKTPRDLILFAVAAVAMGAAFSMFDSTFNNFLSENFTLTPFQRSLLEFPRELPGVLVVCLDQLGNALSPAVGDCKGINQAAEGKGKHDNARSEDQKGCPNAPRTRRLASQGEPEQNPADNCGRERSNGEIVFGGAGGCPDQNSIACCDRGNRQG